MVDGVEGLGEAVTGGMLARAAEPAAGEAAPHGHADKCLNCATPLLGDFCHCCGQSAHVHRTMSAFWHDLLHGVLHFDGKIWRTLPLLAWHPGELTRRYIEGERARFVSPMALFLFSVFLMFAVVNALGGPFDPSKQPAQERAETEREFRREQAEDQAQITKLEGALAAAKAAGADTAPIQARIDDVRLEMRTRRRGYELAMRLRNQEEARGSAKAGKAGEGEDDGGDEKLTVLSETGWEPLDKAVSKAEKNPSLLLYKMQTNAYKFSWALIPISVPFLWMLFLHRRRYRQYKAYDHVVFVTYSIAFMSLGFIALTLLRPLGVGEAVAGLAITFVPPIHMYRQLRGAYRLSRMSALWRMLLLLIFAFIAAALFLTMLIALGAFG